MTKPSYLAQPLIQRLPAILDEIADGTLAIPKFQRPFIWSDEQRLMLMDSIWRGMPIGTLLVWRTSKHKLETYRQLGPFHLPNILNHEIHTYVLDGHQRLSTLYGAFHEANEVSSTDDDRVRWPIYYDLENDKFRLPLRGSTTPRTWLPISLLFNPISLYAYQKELIEAGRSQFARKVENIANKFKDYQLPIVPLATEDLKQVTETFQRVNSTGTTMGEVDMIRALMWSTEFDLSDRLEQVAERLVGVGWGSLDHQILLDTVKIFHDLDVYSATPEEAIQVLKAEPSALEELTEHLLHAITFLSSCWTSGPSALPYKYQLAILADAMRILGGELEGDLAEALRLWFWQTTYTEYFTGMTGTQIRRAVQHVRDLVTGAISSDKRAPDLPPEVRPLGRFNYVSVRSRALVLMLVQCDPRDENGESMLAADLIGQMGVDAVPKIFSSRKLGKGIPSDGPENRWIVTPKRASALYRALFQTPGPTRDELLKSHAVTEQGHWALTRGDLGGFLAARRARLLELEREFVTLLGLNYAEAPPPFPHS